MRFSTQPAHTQGGEHKVSKLDASTLIKWPRADPDLPPKTFGAIRDELMLLEDLGVRMPATQVCENPEIVAGSEIIRPPYCIITELIKGKHLTRRDFDNKGVRRDFAHLLAANRALEARGLYINLFGILSSARCLDADRTISANAMTTEDGLYLVDPSLMALNLAGCGLSFLMNRFRCILQNALGEALLIENF